MSVSIPDFWRVAVESRLLTTEQCQQLADAFDEVKGAARQGNARTLAEWLISENVLTRYQTRILLSGRSGPFVFGEYEVYDSIRDGPLAGMFRAVHTPTSHRVILQFLAGPATEISAQWSLLLERLRTQCDIQHPHLQRSFEVVDMTSFKYLVVEDLRGKPLEAIFVDGTHLSPQEACRIARCAALGLAQLHQTNSVHGGVRPQRLWMEDGGNTKLLRDPLEGMSPIDLTQPDADGGVLTRADYLAPEFLQSGKRPDVLTDIYSLGCTLYHLLAGTPPFPGGDVRQKMSRHANERIQPLEQLDIPQPIAQLVSYMMAKNPAVRYQDASLVAEQLTPMVDASHQKISLPTPAATLTAYESAVQQKQALPAVQPSSIQAVSAALAVPSSGAGQAASTTAGSHVAPTIYGTGAAIKASNSAVRARLNRTKSAQKMMALKIGVGVSAATVLLLFGMILLNSTGGGTDGESGSGDDAAEIETDGSVVPETAPSNAAGQPGAGTNGQSETPASGSGLDNDGSGEGNDIDDAAPEPDQSPPPGESQRNNDLLAFRHSAANNDTLPRVF